MLIIVFEKHSCKKVKSQWDVKLVEEAAGCVVLSRDCSSVMMSKVLGDSWKATAVIVSEVKPLWTSSTRWIISDRAGAILHINNPRPDRVTSQHFDTVNGFDFLDQFSTVLPPNSRLSNTHTHTHTLSTSDQRDYIWNAKSKWDKWWVIN